MRFNAKELACIAQEKSSYFDFESLLFVREKAEGLFKKGKAFAEKLFRLKGNLLFYFKGRDKFSDVAGVYILERCCVQLEEDELDEMHLYCFSIVFEGDPNQSPILLSSPKEPIRDRWIELLHIASCECMKFQLDNLRERIKSKTGADPLLQSQENYLAATIAACAQDMVEGAYLEMSIQCKGLSMDQHGRPPDTFVTLQYFLASSKEQWAFHGRTEVIEKSCNPTYVSVITFKRFDTITLKTKLKLSLKVIKERMTNTAITVGTAEFSLMEILTSPSMSLGFTLRSSKYDEVGTVILTIWLNSNSSNKQNTKGQPSDVDLLFDKSKLFDEAICRRSRPADVGGTCRTGMDPLFLTGRIVKTFRFPVTGPPSTPGLLVNEHLTEFKHCFLLPYHYLEMLIEDEKQKILSYRCLGKLNEKHEVLCSNIIDFHLSTLVNYEQQLKFFRNNRELSFKPSVKKSHKEVEVVPTNLQVHSMHVSSSIHEGVRYDIITVGAFTAGAQKFKHGGVRRLANQLDLAISKGDKGDTRMNRCRKLSRLFVCLRDEICLRLDALCSNAVSGRVEPVRDAFKVLEQQVTRLMKKSEEETVTDGVLQLCAARFISSPSDSPPPLSSSSPLDVRVAGGEEFEEVVQEASVLAESWMWDGTDYVKGDVEEPFDMVKLNTEAALVSLRGRLQELFQQSEEDAVSWLEKVSPQVIALRRLVEALVERSTRGLNFLVMQDVASNLPLYHGLKCRRDAILCQSVTAAVCGFLSKLSCLLSSSESSKHQLASSSSSSSSSLSSTPSRPQNHGHHRRHHYHHQNSTFHEQTSLPSSSSSSSLQSTFSSPPRFNSRSLAIYARIGILMQFESLLSCYNDEMCMLEDHSEGVADLAKVKFRVKPRSAIPESGAAASVGGVKTASSGSDLTRNVSSEDFAATSDEVDSSGTILSIGEVTEGSSATSSAETVATRSGRGSQVKDGGVPRDEVIEYKIVGNRECCEVIIVMPRATFEEVRGMWPPKHRSKEDEDSFCVQLVPVVFSIGINEQATFAEKFFSVELQEELNQENFQKLNNYYKDFCSLPDDLRGPDMKTLNSAMQMLHQNTFVVKKNKNVEVLHLAADICRFMDGVRFTSCKSAKDRTAMSVTLEEVTLLRREHDLSADVNNHALDALRSEGVRRDNTYKNTGVRKYAFNSIQLISIPKQYRPPKGTYGSIET